MNDWYLKVNLSDINAKIKEKNIKRVSNPIFFDKPNQPTVDGLLSYEIFGVTKKDRSTTYGYIDLQDKFLHPLIYKLWSRINSKMPSIIYGGKKYKFVKNELVEDEDGETGLSFIIDNLDKFINMINTDSIRNKELHTMITKNKHLIVIDKFLVSPPYIRDMNINDGNSMGVGEVNKLYVNLLNNTRALSGIQNFGMDLKNNTKGRIQDILVTIYNFFTESDLSSKFKISRRAVLSKTADYASREVITAYKMDAETVDDMMVTMEYTALPLDSVCTNIYPYMQFALRRFFDNELLLGNFKVVDNKGNVTEPKLRDPRIEFSDDRLKKELDRFIHGHSNRLIPIEIYTEDGRRLWLKFKGRLGDVRDIDNIDKATNLDRRMTWCDLFYIIAVDQVDGKHNQATRYPVMDHFGQTITKIRVGSTIKTEPVYIDNKLYKFYPKIREEDINSDTSNLFINSVRQQNPHVASMAGDYDGDQTTNKTIFSDEANDELDNYMNSKRSVLGVDGMTVKRLGNEATQVIYSLTYIKKEDKNKLKDPIF